MVSIVMVSTGRPEKNVNQSAPACHIIKQLLTIISSKVAQQFSKSGVDWDNRKHHTIAIAIAIAIVIFNTISDSFLPVHTRMLNQRVLLRLEDVSKLGLAQ